MGLVIKLQRTSMQVGSHSYHMFAITLSPNVFLIIKQLILFFCDSQRKHVHESYLNSFQVKFTQLSEGAL
jgi:hypothetical protein